jgi:DNA gyrase subunit A
MDVSGKDNYLLAMDVATPGQDLLVVTENGYGKRTAIDEYRLTQRGAKGVKTIAFTESKGLLAAALVVREHQELVFISRDGMVQRTSVRGINRYGRTSQGVRVMNLREADEVSAVALVVESDAPAATNGGEVDETVGVGLGGGPLAGDASDVDGDGDGDGDGIVVEPDPDDELTLQPPEIVDDEMPDHDIEE